MPKTELAPGQRPYAVIVRRRFSPTEIENMKRVPSPENLRSGFPQFFGHAVFYRWRTIICDRISDIEPEYTFDEFEARTMWNDYAKGQFVRDWTSEVVCLSDITPQDLMRRYDAVISDFERLGLMKPKQHAPRHVRQFGERKAQGKARSDAWLAAEDRFEELLHRKADE